MVRDENFSSQDASSQVHYSPSASAAGANSVVGFLLFLSFNIDTCINKYLGFLAANLSPSLGDLFREDTERIPSGLPSYFLPFCEMCLPSHLGHIRVGHACVYNHD